MPDGFADVSTFPGFQHPKPVRVLKLCVDEDKLGLQEEMGGWAGVSLKTVKDAQLEGRDDAEIRRWAKREGRILVTANLKDFNQEGLHPLNECGGIWMLSGNSNVKDQLKELSMLTVIMEQFAGNMPRDWWNRTKLAIKHKSGRLRRRMDGRVREFELRVDERGRLHFKENSSKQWRAPVFRRAKRD